MNEDIFDQIINDLGRKRAFRPVRGSSSIIASLSPIGRLPSGNYANSPFVKERVTWRQPVDQAYAEWTFRVFKATFEAYLTHSLFQKWASDYCHSILTNGLSHIAEERFEKKLQDLRSRIFANERESWAAGREVHPISSMSEFANLQGHEIEKLGTHDKRTLKNYSIIILSCLSRSLFLNLLLSNLLIALLSVW